MLSGEKVQLRAIERRDLENCLKWINDPEVTRYLLITDPVSAVAEEKWIEAAARGDSPNSKQFTVETLDGDYVGQIGLHEIDWRHRHATAGIVIGVKEYWDKGYGSDAMRTLLRYAFDTLNLHKVSLGAFADNKRALRTYEKCGYRTIGVQREHRYSYGRYQDEVMMEVLEDEFRRAEAARKPGQA